MRIVVFGLDPVAFGMVMVVIAVLFIAGAVLITRLVRRVQPFNQPPILPSNLDLGLSSNTDAVLMVRIGGKVIYTNSLAREWFHHIEEEPNLERLARRARPSEVFLSLCASEGQARFSLDGRLVEGSSYFVPSHNGAEGAYLVSLRHPQVTAIAAGESEISGQALDIFSELSQAMASSLDLEKTLNAILDSIERLIPSDSFEITVWEAANQQSVPYQLVGTPGEDRHLEKSPLRYKAGEGYSGHLIVSHEPLLINDVDAFREVRPTVDRKQYPFNSFLGVPLIQAGELIGTVELSALAKNAFSQSDLDVLRALSGQAAVALHNAKQFQEEQQRILELTGLAKLAQAAGAVSDTQDFFARMIEGIKPLLDVEIIGFLIYDEPRRRLEAQLPFVGIPASVIQLYQTTIQPASPAEQLWLSQQVIEAPNAQADQRLADLGMAHLAVAAGIQSTLLIPLTSSGRMLGYLQVADKKDGLPFDEDDLRVLTIIAGQAATVIDNVTLVKQSQERAQRAEALRRIASLTGSTATLDEILSFSLRELARLLRADAAAIYLLDENRAELRLHKASSFGFSKEQVLRFGRISMNDAEFRDTVTNSRRSLFIDDAAHEPELAEAYLPVVEALSLRALIAAPITARESGIGEIIIGGVQAEFFQRGDLQLVSTTASQLATAIEKSKLYSQTDASLRRRIEQLMALTRVSRELNTNLELQSLLQLVYDELIRTTQADCGMIYLFAARQDKTASPQVVLTIGDPLGKELSELERMVLEQGEAIILEDYAQPIKQFGNIYMKPPHEGVAASLLVPIAYQDDIAGLIHLHARSAERFDTTGLEIAQSLATQAAIALGNSQRYVEQSRHTEQLNRRVDVMTRLLGVSQILSADQPLEEAMEAIASGIQKATPFDDVLISIYNPRTDSLTRVAGAGLPMETLEELRRRPQPWKSVQQLLIPEYRYGRSYFIPFDPRRVMPADLQVKTVLPPDGEIPTHENAWHPRDILVVPLLDADGKPQGLVSVDAPRDGIRPDPTTLEALDLFASQAVMVIEGHEKVEVLNARSQYLDLELRRVQDSISHAQASLPVLLHKDVENALAIQEVNRRARRIQAGLDISEILRRQNTRSEILLTFGREFLYRMDMQIVLIAEMVGNAPHLLHVQGTTPSSGINVEAMLGQRNPLRFTLQSGEKVLVPHLDESPDWKISPLLVAMESRAFICLPIIMDEKVDAAVLFISQNPLPPFTPEDEYLYSLICRQVAVALENLHLLDETNRRLHELNMLVEFSRQLGTLDPVSILRTLVDSALQVIPAAHAGMVALWQPEQGCLVPQAALGYIHNEHILEITFRSGQALPGQVYQNGEPMRVDEVNFAQHYNLLPEHLLLYRDATEGRLPISSLLVPIQTAENRLGVLVLDNFKDAAAFTAQDQDLVASLARQTALTLENARLYQASEQRAAQLLALTNLSATITSSLQTDALINSLLDLVKEVIPYDTATLWLRQGESLTIRAAAGFADSDQRLGLSVAIADSMLLEDMTATSQPISVGDVRQDARFPSLMEHQYLSWLGVPLLSKGEVVGVIALEKREANFYSPEHLSAVVTFSGQAAVALVNARLYEESVSRAAELDQRSQRLALLNRLSTELSGSLDMEFILGVVIREFFQAVECEGISVLLFDTTLRAFVHAESPPVAPTYPFELSDCPLFERIHETLGIFSTEDVEHEELLNNLQGFLEERSIRAMLAVPLATGTELLGIVMAYTRQSIRFEADEVELARTICNQLAVAIQNARLFTETERLYGETQQRSAELGMLFELGVSITQVLDLNKLIDATFDNAIHMMKADAAGLVLIDTPETLIARAIDKGERIGPNVIPRAGTSFSEYVLNIGAPLFIRDMDRERDSLPVEGITVGKPVKSWLGVPLVVRGMTVGVLSVQAYRPYAFGEAQLRLLGQVGNQLSVALDNARLFETVQNYADDLVKRVSERTHELENQSGRIQTLLRVITELSASLDLDMVLNRTLAVLNEAIGAEHSLIMLFRPDESALYTRASLGYTSPPPRGGQVAAIKPKEGLVGWVLANRQSALIPDLLEDPRWVLRVDQSNQHRSAMAIPLLMGEENLGVLLLYHRQPSRFTESQLELVQATARQIAVAINNAQLFNLIRDQAERLGDMLRTQHIETSRSQAMLEAVADGVLVTDARRTITLFNVSGETILGLNREQVVGRNLENFMGLFGKAGQAWVQTIRTWSEDPAAQKAGETYSEQIELDDRRVVSVHLSPVLLRNDFLGTVSIFRDITHLIELDRLKSEFVATVSHELRTPMTSIKGYVEILLMGAAGQLNEQQTHFLQVVKSNTERLAILVNDLLDISRIEAGRVTLSLQPLVAYLVVSGSVDAIKRRMEDDGRPMTIDIDLSDHLPPAYGDPERVQQILDNLVENAYQYTPENGKIIVRVRQINRDIQFDVIDNGIGIPPEDQPRIFERFYRGEDPLVLATSGTGLGLSIVRHLVEMHKGRIWFESAGIPGLGTTFSFTIPMFNPEAEGGGQPDEARSNDA